MRSNNPEIEWYQKAEKQCLKFIFGETLTASEAEIAIKKWKEAFQTLENESTILIWDCRKMKGYDSTARTKWTEALKELKPQIETIWLISESAIIRMGASVMGMISAINIKTIKSENEITV